MKLVLEKAKDLKKSMEAVAVLIDEAEFVVGAQGLSLKATDPSQISMVDFSLPKNAFLEFEVQGETKIGLDVDYFRQILARGKNEDKVELSVNAERTSLAVALQSHSKRSFSVPLLDISKSEVPNPKIEFDAQFTLPASHLQDALKDAELVSNHVSIGVEKKTFYLQAQSSKGTLNHEIDLEKESKEQHVKQDAKSMFPLNYLQDMLKAAESDTPVTVFLKSKAPIKLEYPIGPARLVYYLAPRIESE